MIDAGHRTGPATTLQIALTVEYLRSCVLVGSCRLPPGSARLQRPCDTCKLICDSHSHDVEGTSGEESIDPIPMPSASARSDPNERASAIDELSAHIGITSFADPEQAFF